MKRSSLFRHLRKPGCYLKREGGEHSLWCNPKTGDTDVWSDPKGEFLAAVAAEPVFKLLGKQALGTEQMPPAGQPIFHTLGYVMHAGGHGAIPSDWGLFLKFMQMHLQ